ncbi:MAG: hypothetical protein Q8J68_02770 [Methanolobus sp.]|uniref:hypothetical protein n=1 Tax=Methanolobus sp. TaxID=1874737 RepID=UPI0027319D09|nr:hypothetical protein [Methanolobus sp.]MDP2216195.1 hypothetical protein [Methanolobus sp.]
MQIKDSTTQELRARPVKPKKHPLSIEQRVICVLLIVVVAAGLIFYLWNIEQHKIGAYLVNTGRMDWYLTLAAHEKPLVLNTIPYTHRKIQLFNIYSASIIVIALGLFALALRPRRNPDE